MTRSFKIGKKFLTGGKRIKFMKRAVKLRTAFILLLIMSAMLIFLAIALKIQREISLMPDGEYEFPSLYISSELDPFNVERELWHSGQISVRDTTAPFLFENAAVKLRGRGNASWVRGSDKRPLRLRFQMPHAMLDSGYAARDWVLIANLFDLSLIRNHAAFYLADLLDGMNWTPFSRFVHLYINDEYKGVYQLVDERDVGPGRIQLEFHPEPASSEYLFELDGAVTTWLNEKTSGNVEDVDFFGVDEKAYDIHFPKSGDWNGHLEYLRDFVLNAKEIIKTHDYNAIAAIIDIPSFVDFYIVQELFKNADVGNRSMFFQLKGHGKTRRIHFGPVWDFDRSSGNMLHWNEPTHIYAGERCGWLSELIATPEIFDLVKKRWNEIAPGPVAQLIEHIGYLMDNYEEAFERNFRCYDYIFEAESEPAWFVMLPEETKSLTTFREQSQYFVDWLNSRISWLNNYFS